MSKLVAWRSILWSMTSCPPPISRGKFPPKSWDEFTSSEAFRYIRYVCRIFLANSFVWGNNSRIGYLLCWHEKYRPYNIGGLVQWPMALSNKCNTVKHTLRSNTTSELTENLEICLFCVNLLSNVIKITSQDRKWTSKGPFCDPQPSSSPIFSQKVVIFTSD